MSSKKMPELLLLLAVICLNVKFSTQNQWENKLAIANNELGVKLLHKLIENTSENVFISPLSLSTAFGMLYVGTRGNSTKQLRNVLGYNDAKLSNEKVPSSFKQYLTRILPGKAPNENAYTLNLANEILLSKHFDVKDSYKKEVEDFFKAYVRDVDFAGNTKNVVKEVNDWVSQQTHGKINKFLTELSPSTIFLILNAVYFKGTWQTQFNKTLTKNGVFYNHGHEQKEVPFMHIKTKLPYFYNREYEVVELPYKGKDISMIIISPTFRNGLQRVEKSFSAKDIKTIQEQLRNRTLTLTLPKFKMEYSREMSPDFQKLGATDIFNSGLANFTGMTQSKGLFVNQVFHKAAIEVNEEGSEAAAATGISGTRMMQPYVALQNPFLFLILDKRNSLVLFMGRVTNL